ncbi:MAG: peptidoglycan-associated lipoprotein Pal [Proteobacteria bacterium]|nr:peptidoglycan-associated lipoprotein Pal [Pseudomonadota bacterium]
MNHANLLRHAALAAIAAIALAGCSSTKLDSGAPVETRTPEPVNPGANANPAPQSQVTQVDIAAQENAIIAGLPHTVYFDFDSYVVRDDQRNVVDANAKFLGAHRNRHLTIEGHTDSRGGSEYNLALGQKRAEAVAKSLALLGVSDSQMESVSFGKERPAVQGENEAAWAKNRRAELVYR